MNDKEYKDWEMQIEKAKKHNHKFLIEFKKWLKKKSLKANTIKKHIDNVDFYANDFLLHYEIIPVEKAL